METTIKGTSKEDREAGRGKAMTSSRRWDSNPSQLPWGLSASIHGHPLN